MRKVPGELIAALSSRYAVEREIGRGGMATVYAAEDRKHKRRVAIKVFHAEVDDAADAERFMREIEVVANLSHPHILPLYDSGEAEQFLYYVMPLVEAGSLRALLDRERALPLEDATRIAREVASALSYAHGRGVIHRDIKPENILLSSGHALVSDFGIALVNAIAGQRITQTGHVLGTPMYMSFEQVMGDREIDGRSDIYSLGCVVFEMLAGVPPFSGANVQETLAKRFMDDAPSLRKVHPSTPANVDVAVTRALARSAADRFSTVSEFVDALGSTDIALRGLRARQDRKKSIAVLPFDYLGSNPDDSFWSDGLMEEVVAGLSKLQGLRVISRTSSALAKRAGMDVRAIGQKLGVDYVLEGTVRRAGDSIRVLAKLIDASTDAHLWVERYTGTAKDVFELEDKLSRDIVQALNVTLTPEEHKRLAAPPIPDGRAYELWLRARRELSRFAVDALDRALHHVEEAISIVGENEHLYATLGYVHFNYYNLGARLDADTLARVDDCIEKVFALNPSSAQGFMLKGLRAYKAGDIPAAVQLLRCSAEAESTPDTLLWLSVCLGLCGEDAEARRLIGQAAEDDPLNSIIVATACLIHALAGETEAAIAWGRRGHKLDPRDPMTMLIYAWSSLQGGQRERASALFDQLVLLGGDIFTSLGMLFQHALRGDKESASKAGEGVRPAAMVDEQLSLFLAEALALAGARDEALDWLENAVRRGLIHPAFLSRTDALLEDLREDPRFAKLMFEVRMQRKAFTASAAAATMPR
ncbi:protein kinase domain-containing protein [Polyangium aurulentum]|uniref:protein kinase domain-containing protein n=1 Tax=Polyangium aurulentum TaxID=2567896 RepID=UPI0010ADA88C|nr:protein kinase [Polyangium aurulentum]UQA55668.1 protein kinase [Polyangium aurulentum]